MLRSKLSLVACTKRQSSHHENIANTCPAIINGTSIAFFLGIYYILYIQLLPALRGFRITRGFSGTKMRVTRGLGVYRPFRQLCRNKLKKHSFKNCTDLSLFESNFIKSLKVCKPSASIYKSLLDLKKVIREYLNFQVDSH